MIKVQICLLDKSVVTPKYETLQSSGMDLRSAENAIIASSKILLISTGIKLAIPSEYEGQIRSRSGLALKHGITVLNSPGTIDADYRGEIKIILINLSQEDFVIKKGDRIAQLVFMPVAKAELELVTSLNDSERGSNGFGSTGI